MKKYIADSLSFGNLLCGVASIAASAGGRFDIAMAFVFAGALLDGLDGAAGLGTEGLAQAPGLDHRVVGHVSGP